MRCGQCNTDLPAFKFFPRHEFPLNKIRIVLENVSVTKCSSCQRNNYHFGASGAFHVACAAMRELRDYPVSLSGRHFEWAVDFMLARADHDELFAEWLGFANFQTMQKHHLSFASLSDEKNDSPKNQDISILFDEASNLLVRKLGLVSYPELADFFSHEQIPEKLDEQIKAAMEWLEDEQRFPSRTEFLNGHYVIFVDLRSLSEKKEKKDEAEELRSEYLQVKSLLKQAREKGISWPAFQKEIMEWGTEGLYVRDKGTKEIVGVALVNFAEKDKVLRVNRVVLHENLLTRKDALQMIFKRIFLCARDKKANSILMELPCQPPILETAKKLGFTQLDSRHLVFFFKK